MTQRTPLRTFALGILLLVAFGDAGAQPRPGSIAGRILQPDGAAAERARVVAYAVRGTSRTEAGSATSVYDGRYEITGLAPGVYVLGATPSRDVAANPLGVSRPAAAETFYPDATDAQRAQRIQLAEGVPVEGIDVWLAPAPQRYSVGGRIYMPEGVEPRELVIEYGGPDVIRRGIWYVYDPDGLFEIEGVAQGPLVMLARAETESGIFMGVASTIVTVESVQDVRIVMRRPGRIQGRVIFERTLPDATDLRISPVQTLLKLSTLYPVSEAPIARNGAFDIPETLGTYTFEVRGIPEGWAVKRVRRAGRDAPGHRITVAGEEAVTGVEVIVGPGST